MCIVGVNQHSGYFSYVCKGAALLGTAAISTRFCVTAIHKGTPLLGGVGYMLGFARHF